MRRCPHFYKDVWIKPIVRTANHSSFTAYTLGHRWEFTVNGKTQEAPTLQGAKWLIDRQTETTKGETCNS
jgi:hypothetical protein